MKNNIYLALSTITLFLSGCGIIGHVPPSTLPSQESIQNNIDLKISNNSNFKLPLELDKSCLEFSISYCGKFYPSKDHECISQPSLQSRCSITNISYSKSCSSENPKNNFNDYNREIIYDPKYKINCDITVNGLEFIPWKTIINMNLMQWSNEIIHIKINSSSDPIITNKSNDFVTINNIAYYWNNSVSTWKTNITIAPHSSSQLYLVGNQLQGYLDNIIVKNSEKDLNKTYEYGVAVSYSTSDGKHNQLFKTNSISNKELANHLLATIQQN